MPTQPAAPPASDIAMATTRAGYALPVVDVTHPRFAVPDDPQAARALHEAFISGERRRARIPKFIMRMMLRSAARRSRLVHALVQSKAEYLDGLTTYVMKLGADNLVPPFDTPMDRRCAASPHVGLLRLRMQQTARLVADGLTDELAAADRAPLHLINIGGGPALDSINTVILLRRMRPDLVQRPIVIHVLDSAEDGPFFGANALDALKAEGRPLHGLDVSWQHRGYDWNAPATLQDLVATLTSAGGLLAASSEGALFEYGSDEAIVANLQSLRTDGAGAQGACLVAGSVTRRDEVRQRMIEQTGFKLIPRGLAGFAPLAARAGFVIAKSENAWLSDQVLLRPAA